MYVVQWSLTQNNVHVGIRVRMCTRHLFNLSDKLRNIRKTEMKPSYLLLGCGVALFVYVVYTSFQNQILTYRVTPNSEDDSSRTIVLPQLNELTQENWIPPPPAPDNIQTMDQTDPELAQYISNHWLLPPSKLPRNLTNPNIEHYSQLKQSQLADELLHGRRNGFFIECGAFDGEIFSNSLFFEKSRNWTGVLIEADNTFKAMRKKQRHAYLMNVCLSPVKHAVKIPFRLAGIIGGISNLMPQQHVKRIDSEQNNVNRTVLLQCFPMLSVLRAIGVTHVDYFTLDIEGAEPDVLATLPLNDITVDVFSIEHNGFPDKLKQIKDILVVKYGYAVAQQDGQDITLTRKGMN